MSENQLNLLCTIIEEYKILYERVNSIKADLPKMKLSNNALSLLFKNRALKEFMQSMNIKKYYVFWHLGRNICNKHVVFWI